MIDWSERAVCILLSLAILVNAWVVRRMVQSWIFPSVLFSLAWFIYTIVPLVCFPSVHVYPAAMLYLLAASVAVSMGGISRWGKAFSASEVNKAANLAYYRDGRLNAAFYLAFVITLGCLILNSISQGISISQLATNLNDSAAEYAGRRYAYDIVPNIYQQLANILAYFCAGLGGLIISSQRGKLARIVVLFAALAPAIFVMLSQSARGMLFLCSAVFFGGMLAAAVQKNKTVLFSRAAVPTLIIGIAVAIPLVTLSFLARGVTTGAGQSFLESIAPYWASYTSGHLFAFSDWFGSYVGYPAAQSYDDPGLTKGFYTFMSIFKVLGDDRPVPNGVYIEYLFIPPYIGTNIYTMFRGLIHDFGLLGSLVALVVLSSLTHLAFRSMLMSGKPAWSVAVLIFTVAFIYQSFIISAIMGTTLIVGVALIGLVLFLFRLVQPVATGPQHLTREWQELV